MFAKQILLQTAESRTRSNQLTYRPQQRNPWPQLNRQSEIHFFMYGFFYLPGDGRYLLYIIKNDLVFCREGGGPSYDTKTC